MQAMDSREPLQPGPSDHSAVAHGPLQGFVVPLVLVGVALREGNDGPVEGRAAPQVRGQGDAIPGAGVGPGQSPAADPTVGGQAGGKYLVRSIDPFQSLSWRT